MSTNGQPWGYAAERSHSLLESALRCLGRDGFALKELSRGRNGLPCRWARDLARCIGSGECVGGVIFCQDPGLACCVANKVPGVRAVSVSTITEASRALSVLGANFLAVPMPGRTFFEIKHILTMCCRGGEPNCPGDVGCTLAELEGHAHR